MITTIEQGRYFHVTGSSPSMIDNSINAAVETARDHAIREGWQGIIVTRHEPGVYTVAVSGTVPYGEILERDEWGTTTLPQPRRNSDADAT